MEVLFRGVLSLLKLETQEAHKDSTITLQPHATKNHSQPLDYTFVYLKCLYNMV